MGANGSDGLVGTTLFGKSQRGLLSLFFVRPEQTYFMRQIVRNICDYERAGSASSAEADEIAAFARELRKRVADWLRMNYPNLLPN